MSKILNLAEAFENQSKMQAILTDQALLNDCKQHDKIIKEAMKLNQNTMLDAIQQQNKMMRRLMLKPWLYILFSVTLAIVLSVSVIWYQGQMIKKNWILISEQKDTIAQLDSKGGNIQMSNCDGKMCVKIDPQAPTYQGGYRIISEK